MFIQTKREEDFPNYKIQFMEFQLKFPAYNLEKLLPHLKGSHLLVTIFIMTYKNIKIHVLADYDIVQKCLLR